MKAKLIVPNCDRDHVSPIIAYGPTMAEIAGGFTATRGFGGWIDGQGCLLTEPVTVFDLFISDKIDRFWAKDKLTALAQKVARDLGQECVYLEIDGDASFIEK